MSMNAGSDSVWRIVIVSDRPSPFGVKIGASLSVATVTVGLARGDVADDRRARCPRAACPSPRHSFVVNARSPVTARR